MPLLQKVMGKIKKNYKIIISNVVTENYFKIIIAIFIILMTVFWP